MHVLVGKYTNQMLDEKVEEDELLEADHLIFWHLYSVPYLEHLHQMYPKLSMLVMSSALVNYAVDAFSQLRKDMYRYVGHQRFKIGSC